MISTKLYDRRSLLLNKFRGKIKYLENLPICGDECSKINKISVPVETQMVEYMLDREKGQVSFIYKYPDPNPVNFLDYNNNYLEIFQKIWKIDDRYLVDWDDYFIKYHPHEYRPYFLKCYSYIIYVFKVYWRCRED